MSTDKPNYRMERIGRLLHELQYEVTRGVLEREIQESLAFQFTVPTSSEIKGGAVVCEFRTRPVPYGMGFYPEVPKLKVVPRG